MKIELIGIMNLGDLCLSTLHEVALPAQSLVQKRDVLSPVPTNPPQTLDGGFCSSKQMTDRRLLYESTLMLEEGAASTPPDVSPSEVGNNCCGCRGTDAEEAAGTLKSTVLRSA